jgi:hypothetical protein
LQANKKNKNKQNTHTKQINKQTNKAFTCLKTKLYMKAFKLFLPASSVLFPSANKDQYSMAKILALGGLQCFQNNLTGFLLV